MPISRSIASYNVNDISKSINCKLNFKFLLMILPFTTKSHLYRIVTFFNKILIPVYSGAHNGRWTWTQPNVKRCVFLTNNLHLLLYTTVKISPFSGNKEWSIWAFTWISVWPGETTVSLSTPKPQGFLTFCGESYMDALNLQNVRVFAH